MATRGIRFGLRACAPLLALLLVAFGPARAWSDGEDQSLELAIKATFLYKFAPFVEWPDTAFASPSSPLWLCMIGQRSTGSSSTTAGSSRVVEGTSSITSSTVDSEEGSSVAKFETGSRAATSSTAAG